MNSSNHCRNDAALGCAVRMLLQSNEDTADGSCSDWDVPTSVWEGIGVQLEAFIDANANDIALCEVSDTDLGRWWIGDRNGEGIGFGDIYLSARDYPDGEHRAACDSAKYRLRDSAKSQGEISLTFNDCRIGWYNVEAMVWEESYEAAREVYVYEN